MEVKVNGTAQEIYGKIKKKFEEYKMAGKFNYVADISFDDARCSARATGTGFKSVFQCYEGRVEVSLDLNFLLKAMKGKIEEKIRHLIQKAVG